MADKNSTGEAAGEAGAAPSSMSMIDLAADLTSLPGVVIHQRAQPGEAVAQAFGIPYEAKNEYVVSPMPDGTVVASSNTAPELWKPTFEDIKALPELFVMKEDSDCLERIFFTCLGCRAMRPMDVHILEGGAKTSTVMTKPCKCGGWIGNPLEMTVKKEGEQSGSIGRVRENFDPYCSKCCECCCKCTAYHNVYANVPTAPSSEKMTDRLDSAEGAEPKYELKFNTCCCGDSNNFCGATCFNHNSIFQILGSPSSSSSSKGGEVEVVGNIQKMYAPSTASNGNACCRMLYGYDTFAVGFPEGSSQEERIMLIAGVLQAEFALFESDQE